MSSSPATVAERVRARLRAERTDPSMDPDGARRIAQFEVRRHNDLALARGGSMIDDEAGTVRDILAGVSGFGALQPLLDDPEIEEIMSMHRGRPEATPRRTAPGCSRRLRGPGAVSRAAVT
ncbi:MULTISPECIES: hypothetical protein [Bacteria]|uniref:hypothetical protein n=1 Tax=Bacteria TaxID=2 RepID=UPI003C7C3BB3